MIGVSSVTDMRQALNRIRRDHTGETGDRAEGGDADSHSDSRESPADARGSLKAFHNRLVHDMHRFVGASPALAHAVTDEALAEQESAIRSRLKSLRARIAQPGKPSSRVWPCAVVSCSCGCALPLRESANRVCCATVVSAEHDQSLLDLQQARPEPSLYPPTFLPSPPAPRA